MTIENRHMTDAEQQELLKQLIKSTEAAYDRAYQLGKYHQGELTRIDKFWYAGLGAFAVAAINIAAYFMLGGTL